MDIRGGRVGTGRDQGAEARLGQLHDFDEGERDAGVMLVIEDASPGLQTTGRDLQALRCCFQELLLQLAGGSDSGIARHEGDAAGIGAEIDRSERRVGGLQVNLLRLDTQFFGDDIGQHGRGALADVGAATVDSDAASTVQANLHGRVGHVVPVDGLASATDVRRGSQPQAAFERGDGGR